MWNRRVFYLGLLALAILGGVVADTTIVVDGVDPSIGYYAPETNADNGTSWAVIQPSSDSCNTPQWITSRLGDYMAFMFTGTGISIVGTLGTKGGIINFALDGLNITNFDRANRQLICDAVLLQKLGLNLAQHRVVATLVGRETNLQTGQLDGALSIQSVKYTIPGSKTSSVRRQVKPAIVAMIAVIVLIAAAGLAYFFWRKRHPIHRYTPVRRNDDGGEEEHPMVVLRSQHSTGSIRSRHTI